MLSVDGLAEECDETPPIKNNGKYSIPSDLWVQNRWREKIDMINFLNTLCLFKRKSFKESSLYMTSHGPSTYFLSGETQEAEAEWDKRMVYHGRIVALACGFVHLENKFFSKKKRIEEGSQMGNT